MGQKSSLTKNQIAFLKLYLSTSQTKAAVARQLKINEDVMYKWFKEDKIFMTIYEQKLSEQLSGLVRTVNLAVLEAVNFLRTVIADDQEQTTSRIKACQTILNHKKAIEDANVRAEEREAAENSEGSILDLSFTQLRAALADTE